MRKGLFEMRGLAAILAFCSLLRIESAMAEKVRANAEAPVVGVIQLSQTGQRLSYAAGDDGDLQVGVPWPEPRFTDHGDGTARDHLTGLMWITDANVMASRDPAFDTDGTKDGAVAWIRAMDYVAKLNAENYLGCNDWRVPNILEVASLIDVSQSDPALPAGHPFANVMVGYCSSTTDKHIAGGPWAVLFRDLHSNMRSGVIETGGGRRSYNPNFKLHVWPVRTAGTGVIRLPQTGQTRSYYPGDDGDLRKGVAIPIPRFQDLGDGAVRDRLTGLTWTKDANVMPTRDPSFDTHEFPDGAVTWPHALGYVAKLNTETYLGYSDWRLPNRVELLSVIDFGQYSPALALGHPFVNADGIFWTSTTAAPDSSEAYSVDVTLGPSRHMDKEHDWAGSHVWPIRSDPTPLTGRAIRGQVVFGSEGLANAKLTLSGPLTGVTVTDSDGNFEFTYLPNGDYTITAQKLYYSFSPLKRNVTVAGADVLGQGFTASLTATHGWVDVSEKLIQLDPDFSDIHFIGDEGWMTSAEIYHTTDGGDTWEIQSTLLPCHAIDMLSPTEGYAGGKSGFVYHTTDGGKTGISSARSATRSPTLPSLQQATQATAAALTAQSPASPAMP